MGHTKHPETQEFVHHWVIESQITYIQDGDEEGFYKGTCKINRCKEVKYFPSNPATNYQSAWVKMKRDRIKQEKLTVKGL